MSSEPRRKVFLSECAKFQEGYVNPSQREAAYFGNEVKWLRANDLNDGFVFETSRRLSRRGFESAGKSAILFPPESLAISKSGTIGRIGILKDFMCGNRAVINIKPFETCDTRFIFYTLLLNRGVIETLAEGSVQKNLYISSLGRLEIELPNLQEQREIASFLGALDDRIHILRETNTLLEQIAQTIFKSWFVDFDPVRAKQEGRTPEGMDEETAALFPDSFEESELGTVPRGWRVMPFLEACDMLGGAQPPASTFVDKPREGYVRLLQIRDFSTDAHKTYIPDTTKLRKAKEDDILIGRYGSASGDKSKDSLGRVCRGLSGAYNVALMKLSPVEIGPEFALQLVNDPRFYGYLQGVSSKAVQSGFSKSELGQYKVVIPPRQIADEFEATGEALWKRIKTGKETLKTLADLRDTLLPRLISGKLRLPEVEEIVEDAIA